MHHTFCAVSLFLAAILGVGCATVGHHSTQREVHHPTPLDEYVHADDGTYAWTLADVTELDDCTVYTIDLTSQYWPAPEEADRTVWKHWLVVVRPHELKTNKALLYIGGGRNDREAPGVDPRNVAMAKEMGGLMATLHQVPNQPIAFADGKGRSEDDFIAYGWDKYLRTGDPLWLARLPMTKSAVRAMDAVQELMRSAEGGRVDIDGFVVAGGSKRGWTTWTTAAVDTRVIGIAPAVIDLLNLVPSFEHHYRVYGFWAPAVGDYVHHGVMDWTNTPEYEAMLDIVEPFSYRERYTMPKLLLNGTGDQFFLPDSSQFYYDQLPQPKRLRYLPNANHGLDETAFHSIVSFFQALTGGVELPQYSWVFPDENSIRVMTNDRPSEVKLWHATNPEARDFRVETIGKVWESITLDDLGGGVYQGSVETPEAGYRAYMIELTFPGPGAFPHRFTSPVRIVPDTYPHELPVVEEVPKGFLSR